MSRKVLLIEPDYKNKYPPMGLMKLATYFRSRGDDVRYFKGDLKKLSAELLCEELLAKKSFREFRKYFPRLAEYIRTGRYALIDSIPSFKNSSQKLILKEYRNRFRNGVFVKFDVIAITTLFTFHWRKTVDTINFSKKFCSEDGKMIVGGIAATILHEKIREETGINPICGLLDKSRIIDKDNEIIIDELPLDYSILEEIDYGYPMGNAYLAYMTRGCPRKCSFCAVPTLEPEYKDYIGLKNHIKETEARFGAKKSLLLMDNNVFASNYFDEIIDEIKECGFAKGATYIPESEYDIAMRNLKDDFNVRAYTRKLISIYDQISDRLSEADQADFYIEREKRGLLYAEIATKKAIIQFDEIAHPLYEKHFRQIKQIRTVDFNQGVDSRLVTDKKMKKLAEINIRPLRIAFDHYSMKDNYKASIKYAVKHGITNLSNYLLYNYEDYPDELYHRLRLNVDLCEEFGISIYSFPMKFHPIDDPEFFDNREYIGKHWNRKYIRSIQAVLNSTKGKVGRGTSFFNEAFGQDIKEFHKILWMPETFIVHRLKYKNNLTSEWWDKFNNLNPSQLKKLQMIVAENIFDNTTVDTGDPDVDDVLGYYLIQCGSK